MISRKRTATGAGQTKKETIEPCGDVLFVMFSLRNPAQSQGIRVEEREF
jgi:hypothetical protein